MTTTGAGFPQMERLKSAIGKNFVVKDDVDAGRVVTPESLMHFALSTGNLDPLYFDAAYAETSARRRLVPPPTWYTQIMDPHVGCQALYTRLALDAVRYTDDAPVAAPAGDSGPPLHFLDNLRSFDGGIGFRYLAPPSLAQRFTLSGRVTDVVSKQSQRLGQFAVVKGELVYRGEQDEVIVRGFASSLVYPLDNVASQPPAPADPRTATPQAHVVAPVAALEGVRRRGSAPRYWEDVNAGEPIEPLFKGTLDSAEIAVHSLRYGSHPRADSIMREAWRLLSQGEGLAAAALYRAVAADPEFRFGVARHLDLTEAAAEGAPGPYDIGTQRAAWAAQAVTDWMGDAGDMAAFSIEIRGFVVVGDSIWCRGTVAEKYTDNDEHVVRLDVWVENQRTERVAVGSATVRLPIRAKSQADSSALDAQHQACLGIACSTQQ